MSCWFRPSKKVHTFCSCRFSGKPLYNGQMPLLPKVPFGKKQLGYQTNTASGWRLLALPCSCGSGLGCWECLGCAVRPGDFSQQSTNKRQPTARQPTTSSQHPAAKSRHAGLRDWTEGSVSRSVRSVLLRKQHFSARNLPNEKDP